MKKLIILSLLAFSLQSLGQTPETMKKIEAAKIALITERLNLSPAQAEKFWPVYREYGLKNREVRKDFDVARKTFDPNTASEEENKQMLEMANRVKQRQLDLEKEYGQRILKVISTRQMNNLRKAEVDFKEMLLRRIKAQQLRNQQQRNRNGDRLNNRRN